MGALILEFKQNLIKVFNAHGIKLEKNELDVRVDTDFDINKFI